MGLSHAPPPALIFAPRGFSVVGFPCNQFGAQEPGSAEEIATFKAWVDAKTPKGEACTTPPGTVDAGVPGEASLLLSASGQW